MNKKVLTLCASFLLAGGLTSSALASVFKEVTDTQIKEGQYFYVFTKPGGAPTVGAIPGSSTDGVLDVNGVLAGETGGEYWSKATNRETWWRVEKVEVGANDAKETLGFKLINALTGKAFSVQYNDKSYDTFLWETNNSGYAPLQVYTADDADLFVKDVNSNTLTLVNDWQDANIVNYNLQPVGIESLNGEEANKVVNGAFGLQFGYINDKGEYVNYESVEGADALTGTLVAKYGDDLSAFDKITGFTKPAKGAETFCIYNKSADAYVVLLKEKWSASNTNHDSSIEGNGYKFALMTAKQIIEDQNQTDPDDKKIASFIFSINMPVNKDYSPLEVVAKDAVNGKDVELYIANMDNKDYLTTTLAGKRDANNKVTTDDADKVAYDPAKTVVRFGTSDYINFSEFYGYAITIKGLAGTGVEGMTLESNQKVSTEATWTKADYLAFSRPEAQWIVTNENARIVLTNRETKTQTTWGHIFDMLGDGLSLRHESGDTYVSGGYKFEIKKVAELGGETFNHYGVYEKDAEGKMVYRPRTAEEMEQLKSLVKSAVGYDANRGDMIEVENMKFVSIDNAPEEVEVTMFFGFTKEEIMRMLEGLGVAIVAILVILLVIRPLINNAFDSGSGNDTRLLGDNAEEENLLLSNFLNEDDSGLDELINLNKVDGRVKVSSLKKINDLVAKNPDAAVNVIRAWLYQNDN